MSRNSLGLVFLTALFVTAVPLVAEPGDNGEVVREVNTQEAPPDCQTFAFAQGCVGFNLGPIISSDGKGLVFGAAAGLTYFVFDRLGLGLNSAAIFASDYQDYSVGPGLTYYIGPFAGYLITPSYGASRHFLRGAIQAEGWAYGPSIGVMTNLFGRVFWGISVGYTTFQVDGYKSSDWSWSPVVFIPF